MVPAMMRSDVPEALKVLAHELRGPLGAIESIAFSMQLGLDEDGRPEGPQCRELRRLVQQAGWILDDATRFNDAQNQPRGATCLNAALERISERLADSDEAPPSLDLAPELPRALLCEARLESAFEHLLSFMRDVAGCDELPVAKTSLRAQELAVEWTAETPGWEAGELLRWLDPRERVGGLRLFTEAMGGSFFACDDGGRLRVSFLFPALP